MGLPRLEGKDARVVASELGDERQTACCVLTGKKGLDHLMSAR